MKKSRLTAVLAALVILTAGCGGDKAKEIDAKALAGSLLSEVTYEDELQELSEQMAAMQFDTEDGVKIYLYMGGGATTEEVAVFEAPDEEAAKKQLDHVKDFVDDQIETERDYRPEEVKRLEDAVLEQKGKYVILCVSADSDKAKEIIEKAFK